MFAAIVYLRKENGEIFKLLQRYTNDQKSKFMLAYM